MKKSRIFSLAALATAVMLTAGCATSSGNAEPEGPATELRLGYFANVTHAPALVGLEEGFFEDALGATELSTQVFNAGPSAIEALSAGAIDATYIGPNPAINTFIQSGGQSAQIVAGATTGGAQFIVQEGITEVSQLPGTTIATPQLGNTQDVALRSWLLDHDISTDTTGGGDLSITPTENAQIFTLFQKNEISGAWVPEPWASRLVLEAGGEVFLDETELWPNGEFPTTVLLVRKEFLEKHPETVTALLNGHIESINWLNNNAEEAPKVVNNALEALTSKALPEDVITRALSNVTFSVNPHASAFRTLIENGIEAGTQRAGSIDGLFNLRFLNSIRAEAGEEPISADGLGEDTP